MGSALTELSDLPLAVLPEDAGGWAKTFGEFCFYTSPPGPPHSAHAWPNFQEDLWTWILQFCLSQTSCASSTPASVCVCVCVCVYARSRTHTLT